MPAAPSPAAAPRPVITADDLWSIPGWQQVSPPPPLLAPMPLTLSREYQSELTAWQPPALSLGELGHAVTEDAPVGIVAAPVAEVVVPVAAPASSPAAPPDLPLSARPLPSGRPTASAPAPTGTTLIDFDPLAAAGLRSPGIAFTSADMDRPPLLSAPTPPGLLAPQLPIVDLAPAGRDGAGPAAEAGTLDERPLAFASPGPGSPAALPAVALPAAALPAAASPAVASPAPASPAPASPADGPGGSPLPVVSPTASPPATSVPPSPFALPGSVGGRGDPGGPGARRGGLGAPLDGLPPTAASLDPARLVASAEGRAKLRAMAAPTLTGAVARSATPWSPEPATVPAPPAPLPPPEVASLPGPAVPVEPWTTLEPPDAKTAGRSPQPKPDELDVDPPAPEADPLALRPLLGLRPRLGLEDTELGETGPGETGPSAAPTPGAVPRPGAAPTPGAGPATGPTSVSPDGPVDRSSRRGSAIRTAVGHRFGVDLAGVPVERSASASARAQAMGARGYTDGASVVVPAALGSLETGPGAALLAHELTHVAQRVRMDGPFGDLSRGGGRALEAEALRAELPFALPAGAAGPGGPASMGGSASRAAGADQASVARRLASLSPSPVPMPMPISPTALWPAGGRMGGFAQMDAGKPGQLTVWPGVGPTAAVPAFTGASAPVAGAAVTTAAPAPTSAVPSAAPAPAPIQKADAAPAPTPPAQAAQAAQATGPFDERPTEAELSRLASWIYPLISYRLRGELREQRERIGLVTDSHRRW